MSGRQIVVSGLGGQGILFLTRVVAEAAVAQGLPVLTAETHGMAQRGGSVLSTIKVGDFASPLIRRGQGDLGLFLHSGNLPVHGPLLRPDGRLFVNAPEEGPGERIDASDLARELGSPVLANLILLGFAARRGGLDTAAGLLEETLQRLSPPRFRKGNLEGFRRGWEAGEGR